MEYFIPLFAGTFVLEDVALATGLALVAEGRMTYAQVFWACFLGISTGDLALYGLGLAGNFLKLEQRFQSVRKLRTALNRMKHSGAMTNSILLSRMIPGTRLPTYLASGFLKYPAWKFCALTAGSVLIWVGAALAAGRSLHLLLMDHLLIGIMIFLLGLKLVKSIVPPLFDYWDRHALLHSWRRWLAFEFWPAWLFYLPLVPYYLFLALKHRTLLAPFYANPFLLNGGLLGESKWDFLSRLDPGGSATLRAAKIQAGTDFEQARQILRAHGLSYPMVLKPDIGQRGYGVRVIHDEFDLTEYLLLGTFDLIAQELSTLPGEAGLFYVRHPDQDHGSIFSITDKKFPTATGDGSRRLGDLILADARARVIAGTYFTRHRDSLGEVLAPGERIALTACGNHCQGAIFLNGAALLTPALTAAVDRIARGIPEFHFGRFDVRYRDTAALQGGEFEIVEINGAGAEATHIWDASTPLCEAYRTLFAQWALLFAIGCRVKSSGARANIQLGGFLKECLKVVFRKEPLSTSS